MKKFTIVSILTFITLALIGQNTASQNFTPSDIEITDNEIIDEASELKSFSTELHNEYVHVNWKMNHTDAITGFELYKSTDGSSWEMVEFFNCDETPETTFEYIDQTPNWGFNFYRIKTIDLNGVSALLRTAKIVVEYETGAEVGDFFPNPSTNGTSQLNINIPDGGEAIIYIYDGMGKLVRTYNKEVQGGTDTISIELDGLSKGVFFATININRESYSKKIMMN